MENRIYGSFCSERVTGSSEPHAIFSMLASYNNETIVIFMRVLMSLHWLWANGMNSLRLTHSLRY